MEDPVSATVEDELAKEDAWSGSWTVGEREGGAVGVDEEGGGIIGGREKTCGKLLEH